MNNLKEFEKFKESIEKNFIDVYVHEKNKQFYPYDLFIKDLPIDVCKYIDYLIKPDDTKRSDEENTNIQYINLEVKEHIVKLEKHKMSIKIDLYNIQNLQKIGIDFYAEIFTQMIHEYKEKINQSFVHKIKSYADSNYEKSLKWYHKIIRIIFKKYKLRERIKSDKDLIKWTYKKSNEIYISSRRGGANYLITNNKIASIFSDFPGFVVDSLLSSNDGTFNNLWSYGSIGNIKILIDNNQMDDYILLGYKGKKEEPGVNQFINKNVNCEEIYENDLQSILLHTMILGKIEGIGDYVDSLYRIQYLKLPKKIKKIKYEI